MYGESAQREAPVSRDSSLESRLRQTLLKLQPPGFILGTLGPSNQVTAPEDHA